MDPVMNSNKIRPLVDAEAQTGRDWRYRAEIKWLFEFMSEESTYRLGFRASQGLTSTYFALIIP